MKKENTDETMKKGVWEGLLEKDELIFKEIKETYIHKLPLIEYEKLMRWIENMKKEGKAQQKKEDFDFMNRELKGLLEATNLMLIETKRLKDKYDKDDFSRGRYDGIILTTKDNLDNVFRLIERLKQLESK